VNRLRPKSDKGVKWELILAKTPTEKTNEKLKIRRQLFRRFDPNGNGYLSLAEAEKGIKELELDDIFSAKPVMLRAF